MLKAREYNIESLKERRICIPGKEPVLNKAHGVISVCEPDLDKQTLKNVVKAIKTNWISSKGKFLQEFEEGFAKAVGAKYAVAVSSGTSALYLTLATLGITKGDEVIIPASTMVSTAFAVTYLGANPIFVDCDEYYQMNPKLIEEKITPKTKAIMPVHIYGHPVDMDKIEAIAKKHNLLVVYDAAESHGAEYKHKPIGGRGIASCYSFYANKILTTGEGGMVTSNDKEFIDLARQMKNVAFSTERHFWHSRLGYNFHMTNLAAGIGVSQVVRFRELVDKHIYHANYYLEGLKGIKGLRFPLNAKWAKNVYWMFGFEVEPEFGMTRDELRAFLADKGIETRTFFVPMHLQPYYQRLNEHYPVSERLSARGMYIPSSSTLSKKLMDKVIKAIKEAHATT